jgi:hypothetical protein
VEKCLFHFRDGETENPRKKENKGHTVRGKVGVKLKCAGEYRLVPNRIQMQPGCLLSWHWVFLLTVATFSGQSSRLGRSVGLDFTYKIPLRCAAPQGTLVCTLFACSVKYCGFCSETGLESLSLCEALR